MQTVLRVGPYRFYFYSHDPIEPPHIHVDRDRSTAKFWLESTYLASNIGFGARELRKLQNIVEANQKQLLEAWNVHFGNPNG